MRRLRLLAGLLGCLAVLAAGLPAVAFGPAPGMAPAATAVSEPCQHCQDCGSTPCQAAMVDCVLACVAAPPVLIATAVPVPAAAADAGLLSNATAALHGEIRPPDPFPPRA
jgi:hypothetical protein